MKDIVQNQIAHEKEEKINLKREKFKTELGRVIKIYCSKLCIFLLHFCYQNGKKVEEKEKRRTFEENAESCKSKQ